MSIREATLGRWARPSILARLRDPLTLTTLAITALVAFLALHPTLMLIQGSLLDAPLGKEGQWTLEHYREVYFDPDTYHLILNSFVFAVGSSLLSIFFGGVMAWITIRTNAPLRGLFELTAIVHNIRDVLAGKDPTHQGTLAALCLADMGDTGAAFVAIPQIPPRNVTWFRKGKWVHWAKVAFEKYFIYKMKTGSSEPFYEKTVLRVLGIKRLDEKQ